MKKKAIALLLSIAIITVTGCGKTEPTSNEVEVESTTVEEVVTEVAETVIEETVEEVATEEVVEEVNPEEFPVIESKIITHLAMDWAKENCIIQCTETDYLTGEQKYVEYLFNRVDKVFACIDEENLFYKTMAGKESVAYTQNADNTAFVKVTDWKEANSLMNSATDVLFEKWRLDNTGSVCEFTFTEGSDGVNGEYIYAYQHFQNEEGTESYKVSFFINKETNLPFMQVISTTMPAESITVETDEALITGEEPVVREARFMYSYLDETSADWDNFKSTTTLPSEDEVVEVR